MKLIEKVNSSKAVFFDLFHTLFGFDRSQIRSQHTATLLGIPEESWDHIVFNKSENRLRGLDRDKYSIIRELAHQYDPSISEETIRHAADIRERRFYEGLTGFRSPRFEVLKRLRQQGEKIGLISNADSIEVLGWFVSEFPQHFDSVTFSYEIGYLKPEPEIYLHALNTLQVKADDAIFVGDGGSEELRGAKNLGFTTVMTTEYTSRLWPGKIDARRQYSDYVVDDLRKLVEE